jgi:hypothetical protein
MAQALMLSWTLPCSCDSVLRLTKRPCETTARPSVAGNATATGGRQAGPQAAPSHFQTAFNNRFLKSRVHAKLLTGLILERYQTINKAQLHLSSSQVHRKVYKVGKTHIS